MKHRNTNVRKEDFVSRTHTHEHQQSEKEKPLGQKRYLPKSRSIGCFSFLKSLFKWLLYGISAPLLLLALYLAATIIIFTLNDPAINDLWNREKHQILHWDEIEPTLRRGDIILMMGTGPTSWQLANAALGFEMWNTEAMKYSHVAVVVQPATKNSGAIILEAVDNEDVQCPDIHGIVQYNNVQLVSARSRVLGKEGDRWCYNRCGIRQLHGMHWDESKLKQLDAFLSSNIGRPMDQSPTVLVGIMNWKLHRYWKLRANESIISCSEVVADFFKSLGLIAASPHDVMVQSATDSSHFVVRQHVLPSVAVAPMHFLDSVSSKAGRVEFVEPFYLGEEIRVDLSEKLSPKSKK